MNKHAAVRLLVASVLAGQPLALLANGLRLPSQDAFATARGEAFVATADNPSAVYYNPAGITQSAGTQLRGGIYGIHFDPTFVAPAGGKTYHVEHKLAAAPNFFLTHTPEQLPLSFGLGLYAPFGGSIEWPENTGFRAVALKSSLTYVTLNPVLAWKVAPSLSIAAGAMVNYAKMELEQGLRPFPQPPKRVYRHFQPITQTWSTRFVRGKGRTGTSCSNPCCRKCWAVKPQPW